jgi:hypothetical protein
MFVSSFMEEKDGQDGSHDKTSCFYSVGFSFQFQQGLMIAASVYVVLQANVMVSLMRSRRVLSISFPIHFEYSPV